MGILNRAYDSVSTWISGHTHTRTASRPKTHYEYQMAQLVRASTTDTPDCESIKKPRHNLLYGRARVRSRSHIQSLKSSRHQQERWACRSFPQCTVDGPGKHRNGIGCHKSQWQSKHPKTTTKANKAMSALPRHSIRLVSLSTPGWASRLASPLFSSPLLSSPLLSSALLTPPRPPLFSVSHASSPLLSSPPLPSPMIPPPLPPSSAASPSLLGTCSCQPVCVF